MKDDMIKTIEFPLDILQKYIDDAINILGSSEDVSYCTDEFLGHFFSDIYPDIYDKSSKYKNIMNDEKIFVELHLYLLDMHTVDDTEYIEDHITELTDILYEIIHPVIIICDYHIRRNNSKAIHHINNYDISVGTDIDNYKVNIEFKLKPNNYMYVENTKSKLPNPGFEFVSIDISSILGLYDTYTQKQRNRTTIEHYIILLYTVFCNYEQGAVILKLEDMEVQELKRIKNRIWPWDVRRIISAIRTTLIIEVDTMSVKEPLYG